MATTTQAQPVTLSPAVNTSPYYSRQLVKFGVSALISLFALLFLVIYLIPMGNMLLLSVRSQAQISQTQNSSVFPMNSKTYNYQGQDLTIYDVPQDSGGTKELALVKGTRVESQFVDPTNPDAGIMTWKGNWHTLTSPQVLAPAFTNYPEAWDKVEFPRLFFNTLFVAVVGLLGALLSGMAVAYAFARFPIPFKNVLFLVLIGTIILPTQVTLIPTYAFFAKIGWTNTWLPLIVPHFFANAYNVFLLRQYFMTLPRELDEAAMMDGAGPFQILVRVIIPQSWPVIISVCVFHFIFAWNDFFAPLIYLVSRPDLWTISIGVQQFNFQFGPRPELVQATSLMAMVLPLIIFFLAQRFFMRGVVITGVEK